MADLDHDAIAEGMGARIKGKVPIRHGSIGSEQMAAEIAVWLWRDRGGEPERAEDEGSERPSEQADCDERE